MRTTPFSILACAIVICLLLTAGCTSTPSVNKSVPTTLPQPTPVSLDATPIQYKDVNGVRLAYREFGAGEPLLMITGFGNTMTDWNTTFIGILASQYHVYIYDPRGMGNSSEYTTTPSVAQFSEDAAALMTALGYDSMHVYGVSMGSSTAQQLVIDHPGRVRKLILDSNTYSIRIPETKLLLEVNEYIAGNSTQSEGSRKEALANLAWNGSYDGLSGINKSVMLVVGTADNLTPEEVSLQMAGKINGSWLVRFKGLPHFGSKYAPVEYGENALSFLAIDESPEIST